MKSTPEDTAIDMDTLMTDIANNSNCQDSSKNTFAESVLANLATSSEVECPICLDVAETPLIIPSCMHQWYVAWCR